MTSFQSSELTELPVVENSQLFAQRAHSARYAPPVGAAEAVTTGTAGPYVPPAHDPAPFGGDYPPPAPRKLRPPARRGTLSPRSVIPLLLGGGGAPPTVTPAPFLSGAQACGGQCYPPLRQPTGQNAPPPHVACRAPTKRATVCGPPKAPCQCWSWRLSTERSGLREHSAVLTVSPPCLPFVQPSDTTCSPLDQRPLTQHAPQCQASPNAFHKKEVRESIWSSSLQGANCLCSLLCCSFF